MTLESRASFPLLRLNAATHELRVPDDAIAAGRSDYALVRKHDDATLALLHIGPRAAIDVHVARTNTPFDEISDALPALLARLATALRLETRVNLRLIAGGASFGGKGHQVAALGTPPANIARGARRLLERAAPGAGAPRSSRGSCVGVHAALGIPTDYGRAHGLAESREPRLLACIGPDVFGRIQWLAPRAAQAWQGMRDAARADGVELQLVSAYRSIAYQAALVRRKLDRGQDMAEILRVSAAPGYSEHHTGRALDLGTYGCKPLEEEFERSAAFGWLVGHAARFGFRLSYPRGNPHGIAYEPWHWCYMR